MRENAPRADQPRPAFLITVDVEGDDLWARPRVATTRNAEFLPRFQQACEAFGLRPTYLVDYDMANTPAFREFGQDVLRRRVGEIGMHLHAWNTPPLVPLTGDDLRYQPYLMEYPPRLLEEKVRVMTGVLEEQFGVRPVSHRAGRWGLDAAYAHVLLDRGYRVDCSVTPGVSWRQHLGDPRGHGGPDYTAYPHEAYLVDLDDIRRPGRSPLLEVPVTIVPSPWRLAARARQYVGGARLARRVLDRFLPTHHWLRPTARNRGRLTTTLEAALAAGPGHLELMLHSSELMPGGSPSFPTADAIEEMYRGLADLFAAASRRCIPATLAEFYAGRTAPALAAGRR
jgi:hypothetical protein